MRSLLKPKISNNQQGMASIFTVLILMAVLALISIGFSQLMNREARQALDRQLATAAYYAAESGVNDARNYISSGSAASFTGCRPPTGNNHFVKDGNVSGDNIATYSCVNLETQPKELIGDLAQGESRSYKLDLPTLSKLYFGWENQSYGASGAQPLTSSGIGTLPREDNLLSSDSTGLLRIAIYPVSAASVNSSNTNNALNNDSRNYFLYPHGGSGNAPGSVNYLTDNGTFVDGNCSSANFPSLPNAKAAQRYCNSVVTNLDGRGQSFYVRLTALYANLSYSIVAADGAGNSLKIPNVQADIDVTGSANDVLKRVRAVVPIGENYDYPGYGLQSMKAICKLFRVEVETRGVYGNTRLDSPFNDDNTCAIPFNSDNIQGGGQGSMGNIPCPTGYVGNYPNCQLPSDPGGGPGGGGGSPPSVVSFEYLGASGSSLRFSYECEGAASASITVDPDRHGGGSGDQPLGGTQGESPIGGPYQPGDSGSATLNCTNSDGTATASKSWSF